MKSFITFLIKRKCLSLVTSFNLLFKATAAITESTAGIGFPVFSSSVEIFKSQIVIGFRRKHKIQANLDAMAKKDFKRAKVYE